MQCGMPDRAFHTERTLRRRDGGLIGGAASNRMGAQQSGSHSERRRKEALLRFRLAEAECGGLCGDESPLTLWRSSTPLIRSKRAEHFLRKMAAARRSALTGGNQFPPCAPSALRGGIRCPSDK